MNDAFFALDPTRHYPVLERADGVYVWDTDGNRYLDAIAGIAVANVGYGRSEVVQAMAAQAEKLPYVAGNIFGNEPIKALAERIAALTPGDLNSIHFTSGGSEAVEVALKLARQYHVITGAPERTIFIARWNGYHGATLGTLAVGGSRLRRRVYEPLLMPSPHIAAPYCYRCPWPNSHPNCGIAAAAELETAILEAGPDRVAAFIAEPIVASVGGAIRPQDDYWPRIREICDRYGVLLIVDEILTGFGRTGRVFAMDHWNVTPDLLAMGKGVAGGYAPLGGVAVREFIRQAFIDARTPFDHVFTFANNPTSAAAGLAVLDIWEREGLCANAAAMEGTFQAALDRLREHELVGDVRVSGLMAGIEFVADRETRAPFPAELKVSARVRDAGLRHGVVTYPGSGMADRGLSGDIISIYPPLVFTEEHVWEMAERLDATLVEVGRELGRL